MSNFTNGGLAASYGSGVIGKIDENGPESLFMFGSPGTLEDKLHIYWGEDKNNSRKFFSGVRSIKQSVKWEGGSVLNGAKAKLKAYYPDVSEGIAPGDILFLVATGNTYGGSFLEAEVNPPTQPNDSGSVSSADGWTRLDSFTNSSYHSEIFDGYMRTVSPTTTSGGTDLPRATTGPYCVNKSFMSVWYKIADSSASSGNYAEVKFNWNFSEGGIQPAYDYWNVSAFIFGYRKANRTDYGFTELDFVPNSDEYNEYEALPGGFNVYNSLGEYVPENEPYSFSPWQPEGQAALSHRGLDPERIGYDEIKWYNKLAVSIIAATDVAVTNWQYNNATSLSSDNPNGWVKRYSTCYYGPSIIIGDAFMDRTNSEGMNGFTTYWENWRPDNDTGPGKDGPVPVGLGSSKFNVMTAGFSILGYNAHKEATASGICSVNGLLKFIPDSLAFPDSSSLTIFKNGSAVIEYDLSWNAIDNNDRNYGSVSSNATVEHIHYKEALKFNANLSNLSQAFLWEDGSGVNTGLAVKPGDLITILARSAKNDNETFIDLTIEGFPMQYKTIMSTDLRDSGGHRMDIIQMEDFGTTYPVGGLVITPADFGMTNIKYMQIQSGTAYSETAEDIAVLASQQTASAYLDPDTGETYWKINVFVPDPETGLPVELASGAPLEFPVGIQPTIMVLGA